MTSFRHQPAGSRIVYGADCLANLASEVRRTGATRALVVCGSTLSRRTPGLETLCAALGDLYVGSFCCVVEQSPLSAVVAAADQLRETQADAVVALGGGSAIVTARAASILAAENKPVEDMATRFSPGSAPISPRLTAPKARQFIVPTTPTTAYGKIGAAVTLPGGGRRLALYDPKVRADAIFFDPALFLDAPVRLRRDAALDCFALGIQGVESPRREPMADAGLLQGLRLLHRHLVEGCREHAVVDDVGALMLAALMIGNATDVTGSGLASAIGHAVGARYGIANGQVKAAVLPHAIRFNACATGVKVDDALDVLGVAERGAEELAAVCTRLFANFDLPTRLRDLGVPHHQLPPVIEDVELDYFSSTNPRLITRTALLDFLERAW